MKLRPVVLASWAIAVLLTQQLWAGRFSTCRGSCGKQFAACSCVARCVVLRSCCEDFLDQCPSMAEEARVKYSHMMSLDVVCSKDGVYIITSCPADRGEPRVAGGVTDEDVGEGGVSVELHKPLNYASLDEVSRFCWDQTLEQQSEVWGLVSDLKEKRKMLSSATVNGGDVSGEIISHVGEDPLRHEVRVISSLAQPRISDKSSGFVFSNASVFRCNARPESVPCPWSSAINPIPNEYAHVKQILLNTEIVPYPPDDSIISWNSIQTCYPLAIDDCNRNSSFYTAELREKCLSFTTLGSRNLVLDGEITVYRNRYCSECVEGPSEFKTIPTANPSQYSKPTFSTLLVLRGSKILVFRVDSRDQFRPKKRSGWHHAVCLVRGQLSCKVTKCGNSTEKRPDGVCKKPFFLHLAVRVTGWRAISRQEHERLARFLHCLVASHLGYDVGTASTAQATVYLMPADIVFYGSVLTLYILDNMLHIQRHELSFSGHFGDSLMEILNERQPNKFPLNLNESQRSSPVRAQRILVVKSRGQAATFIASKRKAVYMNLGDPYETSFCFCVSTEKDQCVLECLGVASGDINGSETVRNLKHGSCYQNYVTAAVGGCRSIDAGTAGKVWCVVACGILHALNASLATCRRSRPRDQTSPFRGSRPDI